MFLTCFGVFPNNFKKSIFGLRDRAKVEFGPLPRGRERPVGSVAAVMDFGPDFGDVLSDHHSQNE